MKNNIVKICIFLFPVIVTILTACQKDPDTEIVINRNLEVFANAMQEDLPEDFEQSVLSEDFSNNWQDYFEKYNGKFKMTIDADIIISDAIDYPVAVIEPYYIPIEQANKIIEGIYGTTDIYLNTTTLSKKQLEETLLEVKAELQVAKNDKDDEKVVELQNVIDYILIDLENAPEEVIPQKYNGQFLVDEREEVEHYYIVLRENPSDKNTPALAIHIIVEAPYSNGYDSSVIYENIYHEVYTYYDDTIYEIPYYEHPVFNTEQAKEAIKKANEFIDTIGIEDREIERIVARTKEQNSNEITSYLIIYSKKFNGIAISPYVQLGGSATGNNIIDEEKYVASYMLESLQVEIEGDQIVYFAWMNPFSIKEIGEDNIRLMTFDKIMSNAENQLAVKYAYLSDRDAGLNLYVDKIILTYAVEPIKDAKYEYMLIPVWAFYGGYDYREGYKTTDGTILTGKQKVTASLLTINAVDGTVIYGQ